MWERFSYYGMRALLILYMTSAAAEGGLGLEVGRATTLYGLYTSSVYLASLPGGWLADRFLGHQNAIIWGGALIALGQFLLLSPESSIFLAGLVVIVAGTGLLKSNAATVVGQLYPANDPRRDAGFSIFYTGINLGAMIAPIICGYIGQRINYRYGFAVAGLGMIAGLIQFQLGRRHLGSAGLAVPRTAAKSASAAPSAWTPAELRRLLALGALVVASAVFWSLYEQAGSTLNLFAEERSTNAIGSWTFPSSWLQAVPALMVIALAPVFAWIWVKLGPHDPSPVFKFTLGLVFAGLGFLLLVPAAKITMGGARVAPIWLIGTYLLHTIGELCLSPVGLSATTRLAPARAAGFLMGIWYLSIAIGNYLGGAIAGFYGQLPLDRLFLQVAAFGIVSGLILLAFARPIQRLMGGER